MTTTLAQLELLAHVDDLVRRLSAWSEESSVWESVQHSKTIVRRTLERIEPLRARVEAPLVVATFGGTGVGKSSLVNALIGEEVTTAGRERPTTIQPIVLAHPRTDLGLYDLPMDELRVVRRDLPILRDIVLIDCPDPDTTEGETADSNLARLRRLLPYCDVLLCVSTQQKYRSARVSDELLQAAGGCRLVFVQTHADMDVDIRDDWRKNLNTKYAVTDLFFVDSRRALQEQQARISPTGEFGRLIDLLFRELSAAQRVRVRRANLLGLVHEVLEHALQTVGRQAHDVEQLERALADQRQRATSRMAERLQEELLVSRGLWEQRLLGQITELWGYSPFAAILRLWHSQASLLASYTLIRAKTTAQMALIGILHGSRMLTSRSQEQEADRRLENLSSFGLNDAELREAQLVVAGYIHAAKLERLVSNDQAFDRLRQAAANAQDEFLYDAAQRIDELILETAKRHSHWFVRFRYELLFALLPCFLIYRAGKNFFFDSFWLGKPHLDTNFYIPAALFFVLWAAIFVMAFTTRLRGGLTERIRQLAHESACVRVGGLFPDVDLRCQEFATERERIEVFLTTIDNIRNQYSGPTDLAAVKS